VTILFLKKEKIFFIKKSLDSIFSHLLFVKGKNPFLYLKKIRCLEITISVCLQFISRSLKYASTINFR